MYTKSQVNMVFWINNAFCIHVQLGKNLAVSVNSGPFMWISTSLLLIVETLWSKLTYHDLWIVKSLIK